MGDGQGWVWETINEDAKSYEQWIRSYIKENKLTKNELISEITLCFRKLDHLRTKLELLVSALQFIAVPEDKKPEGLQNGK